MFSLRKRDTALPRNWEGRYRTAASLVSTIPNYDSTRQARPSGNTSERRRRAECRDRNKIVIESGLTIRHITNQPCGQIATLITRCATEANSAGSLPAASLCHCGSDRAQHLAAQDIKSARSVAATNWCGLP